MKSELLNALINKKIIGNGTNITAEIKITDFGKINIISVIELLEISNIISYNDEHYKIDARHNTGIHRIEAKHIIKIDGMNPEKLASIFNIKSDGTFRHGAKKRGRKSKNKAA